MDFDRDLLSIGSKLVEYCRTGQEMRGLDELYSPKAVSVEALAMPGADSRETHGIDAIKGKHDWWNSAHTTNEAKVEGPFVHGADQFALIFDIDVTNKMTNQRVQTREVGVYTVEDSKIVREDFFYASPA